MTLRLFSQGASKGLDGSGGFEEGGFQLKPLKKGIETHRNL
jgi:hypothetical protein